MDFEDFLQDRFMKTPPITKRMKTKAEGGTFDFETLELERTRRMGNYKDLDSLTEGTHFESPEAKLERTKKEGFPTVAMDEYISRRIKKEGCDCSEKQNKAWQKGQRDGFIMSGSIFLAVVILLALWVTNI